MKPLWLLLFVIILQNLLFAQVETVPSDNFVYDFLKNLSVKGIIKNYDDIVLPLSKKKIGVFLIEADQKKELLSETEKGILDKFLRKLDLKADENPVIMTEVFLSDINSFMQKDKVKYLYSYKDSSLRFYLNPVIENQFIYSTSENASSNLFNFGGKFYGTYSDWFGFYTLISNGINTGNRSVAELNQLVNQSYTFNNTQRNNFDHTEGYIRLERGDISLQIGSERILWGRGINKLIISGNAPEFNFIRFNASFNIFNIDFLHGWLEQPAYFTFDPVINDYVKHKDPKYIAACRFGINPTSNLSLGIDETIIYANRPVELAYLTPFLFFESAQRSLNDLDNSFLGFDARFRVLNGLEISSIINFDDIDFSTISTEGFGSIQTRYSWQTNLILTNPVLPENMVLSFDYLIIRPYMYSHTGAGESLLYTNNSFMLGPDLQPNSIKFSFMGRYICNPDFIITAQYDNIRHGDNITDQNGNLIRNVGGNIAYFYRLGDSRKTHILDGILRKTDKISVNCEYEFSLGFYLGVQFDYMITSQQEMGSQKLQNYWGILRYNIL